MTIEVKIHKGRPVVHVNGKPEPKLLLASRSNPKASVPEALMLGLQSGAGEEFLLFEDRGENEPEKFHMGLRAVGDGKFYNVTGAADVGEALSGTGKAGLGQALSAASGAADLLGLGLGSDVFKEGVYKGEEMRGEAHGGAELGAMVERGRNEISPARALQFGAESAPVMGLSILGTRGLGGVGLGDTAALGISNAALGGGEARAEHLELYRGLGDPEGNPIYPGRGYAVGPAAVHFLTGTMVPREARNFYTGRFGAEFGPPGKLGQELRKGLAEGGQPFRGAATAGMVEAMQESPEESAQLASSAALPLRGPDPDASTYLHTAALAAAGGFGGGAMMHVASNIAYNMVGGNYEQLLKGYEQLRKKYSNGGTTFEQKMMESRQVVDDAIDRSAYGPEGTAGEPYNPHDPDKPGGPGMSDDDRAEANREYERRQRGEPRVDYTQDQPLGFIDDYDRERTPKVVPVEHKDLEWMDDEDIAEYGLMSPAEGKGQWLHKPTKQFILADTKDVDALRDGDEKAKEKISHLVTLKVARSRQDRFSEWEYAVLSDEQLRQLDDPNAALPELSEEQKAEAHQMRADAAGVPSDDSTQVTEKQGVTDDAHAAREAEIDKRFTEVGGRFHIGQETGQDDIKRGLDDDPIADRVQAQLASEQGREHTVENITRRLRTRQIPEQSAKGMAKMIVDAAWNFKDDPDSVFDLDSDKKYEERTGLAPSPLGIESDKVLLWNAAKDLRSFMHPEHVVAKTVEQEVEASDPNDRSRHISAKRVLHALAADNREAGDTVPVTIARVSAPRGGVIKTLAGVEMDISQMRLGSALARAAPLLVLEIMENQPDISPEELVVRVLDLVVNDDGEFRPEMVQMFEIGGMHKFLQMLEGPVGDKYRSVIVNQRWPHRSLREIYPHFGSMAWPWSEDVGYRAWKKRTLDAKSERDSEHIWFDEQLSVPRGNEKAIALAKGGSLNLARYVLDPARAKRAWRANLRAQAAGRMAIVNRVRKAGEGELFPEGLEEHVFDREDITAYMWNIALNIVQQDAVKDAMDKLGYGEERAARARDIMPLMPVFIEGQVFRFKYEQAKMPRGKVESDAATPAPKAEESARQAARGGLSRQGYKAKHTNVDPSEEELSDVRRATMNNPEAGIKKTVDLFKSKMGREGTGSGGRLSSRATPEITRRLAGRFKHEEEIDPKDVREGDMVFYAEAGPSDKGKDLRHFTFRRTIAGKQEYPDRLSVESQDEGRPIEHVSHSDIGKVYRFKPPVVPVGQGASQPDPGDDVGSLLQKVYGAPEPQHIERPARPTIDVLRRGGSAPQPPAAPKKAAPAAPEPAAPAAQPTEKAPKPGARSLSDDERKSLDSTSKQVERIWETAKRMKGQFPAPPTEEDGPQAAVDFNTKEGLFGTIRSAVMTARAEIKGILEGGISPPASVFSRLDSAVARASRASENLRKRIEKETGVDQAAAVAAEPPAAAPAAPAPAPAPAAAAPAPAAPAAQPAAAAPAPSAAETETLKERIERQQARLDRLKKHSENLYEKGLPTEESMKRDQLIRDAEVLLNQQKAALIEDIKKGLDDDPLGEVERMLTEARRLHKEYMKDPRSKVKESKATVNFKGVMGRAERRRDVIGDLLRYDDVDRAITMSERLVEDQKTIHLVAWNKNKGLTPAKSMMLQDIAEQINAAVRSRESIEEVQKRFAELRDRHKIAHESLAHEMETGKDDEKLNLEAYVGSLPGGQRRQASGEISEQALELAGSMVLEAGHLAGQLNDKGDDADFDEIVTRIKGLRASIEALLDDVPAGPARRNLEALEKEAPLAYDPANERAGSISWLDEVSEVLRALMARQDVDKLPKGSEAAMQLATELKAVYVSIKSLTGKFTDAIGGLDKPGVPEEEAFEGYQAAYEMLFHEKEGAIPLLEDAHALSERVFQDEVLLKMSRNTVADFKNALNHLSVKLRSAVDAYDDEDQDFTLEDGETAVQELENLAEYLRDWGYALADVYPGLGGRPKKSLASLEAEGRRADNRRARRKLLREFTPRHDELVAHVNSLMGQLFQGPEEKGKGMPKQVGVEDIPELASTVEFIHLKMKGIRGAIEALAKDHVFFVTKTWRIDMEASMNDLALAIDDLVDFLNAGGRGEDLHWDRSKAVRGESIKWGTTHKHVRDKGIVEYIKLRTSLYDLTDQVRGKHELLNGTERAGLSHVIRNAMDAARYGGDAKSYEEMLKGMSGGEANPLSAQIVSLEKRMAKMRSWVSRVPEDKAEIKSWIDGYEREIRNAKYALRRAWGMVDLVEVKRGDDEMPTVEEILRMADDDKQMAKNRAQGLIDDLNTGGVTKDLQELAKRNPDWFKEQTEALRNLMGAAEKVKSARKPNTAKTAEENMVALNKLFRAGMARAKQAAKMELNDGDRAALGNAEAGEGGKAAALTDARNEISPKAPAKKTKSQRAAAKSEPKTKSQRAAAAAAEPEPESEGIGPIANAIIAEIDPQIDEFIAKVETAWDGLSKGQKTNIQKKIDRIEKKRRVAPHVNSTPWRNGFMDGKGSGFNKVMEASNRMLDSFIQQNYAREQMREKVRDAKQRGETVERPKTVAAEAREANTKAAYDELVSYMEKSTERVEAALKATLEEAKTKKLTIGPLGEQWVKKAEESVNLLRETTNFIKAIDPLNYTDPDTGRPRWFNAKLNSEAFAGMLVDAESMVNTLRGVLVLKHHSFDRHRPTFDPEKIERSEYVPKSVSEGGTGTFAPMDELQSIETMFDEIMNDPTLGAGLKLSEAVIEGELGELPPPRSVPEGGSKESRDMNFDTAVMAMDTALDEMREIADASDFKPTYEIEESKRSRDGSGWAHHFRIQKPEDLGVVVAVASDIMFRRNKEGERRRHSLEDYEVLTPDAYPLEYLADQLKKKRISKEEYDSVVKSLRVDEVGARGEGLVMMPDLPAHSKLPEEWNIDKEKYDNAVYMYDISLRMLAAAYNTETNASKIENYFWALTGFADHYLKSGREMEGLRIYEEVKELRRRQRPLGSTEDPVFGGKSPTGPLKEWERVRAGYLPKHLRYQQYTTQELLNKVEGNYNAELVLYERYRSGEDHLYTQRQAQKYSQSLAEVSEAFAFSEEEVKDIFGKARHLGAIALWMRGFHQMSVVSKLLDPTHEQAFRMQNQVMGFVTWAGRDAIQTIRSVTESAETEEIKDRIQSAVNRVRALGVRYMKMSRLPERKERKADPEKVYEYFPDDMPEEERERWRAKVEAGKGVHETWDESFQASMAKTLRKRHSAMSDLYDAFHEYLGGLVRADHGEGDAAAEAAGKGSDQWLSYVGMMLVQFGGFLADNEAAMDPAQKSQVEEFLLKTDWSGLADEGLTAIRGKISQGRDMVKRFENPFVPENEDTERTHDFEALVDAIRSKLFEEQLADREQPEQEDVDDEQSEAEEIGDRINAELGMASFRLGPTFKLWSVSVTREVADLVAKKDIQGLHNLMDRTMAEISARTRSREGAKSHYRPGREKTRRPFGEGQKFGRGAKFDKGAADKRRRQGYHLMDAPRSEIVDQLLRDPESHAGLMRIGNAMVQNKDGERVRIERGDPLTGTSLLRLGIEGEEPLFYVHNLTIQESRNELHAHIIAAAIKVGYTAIPVGGKPGSDFTYGDRVMGITHSRDGHVRWVSSGFRLGEITQDGEWAGTKIATDPVSLDRGAEAISVNKRRWAEFEQSELGQDLIRVYKAVSDKLKKARELHKETLENMRHPQGQVDKAKARAGSRLLDAELLRNELEDQMRGRDAHLEMMEGSKARIMKEKGLTEADMDRAIATFDKEAGEVFHQLANVRREIRHWEREARYPTDVGISQSMLRMHEGLLNYATRMLSGLRPIEERVYDTIVGTLGLMDYPWDDWHVKAKRDYQDVGFGGFIITKVFDDKELASSLPDIRRKLRVDFDMKESNPVRVFQEYAKRFGMGNTSTFSHLTSKDGDFPVRGDYIMMFRQQDGNYVAYLEKEGRHPTDVLKARGALADVTTAEHDIFIAYYAQDVHGVDSIGPVSSDEMVQAFNNGQPMNFSSHNTDPTDMFWALSPSFGHNDVKQVKSVVEGDTVMVVHQTVDGSDSYTVTQGNVDGVYKDDNNKQHLIVSTAHGSVDIPASRVHAGVVASTNRKKIADPEEDVKKGTDDDMRVTGGDGVRNVISKGISSERDAKWDYPAQGQKYNDYDLLHERINYEASGLAPQAIHESDIKDFSNDPDPYAARREYSFPRLDLMLSKVLPDKDLQELGELFGAVEDHEQNKQDVPVATSERIRSLLFEAIGRYAEDYLSLMKEINVPRSMLALLKVAQIHDQDLNPGKGRSSRARANAARRSYDGIHKAMHHLFEKYPYPYGGGKTGIFNDAGVALDPQMMFENESIFCVWRSFALLTGDSIGNVNKQVDKELNKRDVGWPGYELKTDAGFTRGLPTTIIDRLASHYGLVKVSNLKQKYVPFTDEMLAEIPNAIYSVTGHVFAVVNGIAYDDFSVHPSHTISNDVREVYVLPEDAAAARRSFARRGRISRKLHKLLDEFGPEALTDEDTKGSDEKKRLIFNVASLLVARQLGMPITFMKNDESIEQGLLNQDDEDRTEQKEKARAKGEKIGRALRAAFKDEDVKMGLRDKFDSFIDKIVGGKVSESRRRFLGRAATAPFASGAKGLLGKALSDPLANQTGTVYEHMILRARAKVLKAVATGGFIKSKSWHYGVQYRDLGDHMHSLVDHMFSMLVSTHAGQSPDDVRRQLMTYDSTGEDVSDLPDGIAPEVWFELGPYDPFDESRFGGIAEQLRNALDELDDADRQMILDMEEGVEADVAAKTMLKLLNLMQNITRDMPDMAKKYDEFLGPGIMEKLSKRFKYSMEHALYYGGPPQGFERMKETGVRLNQQINDLFDEGIVNESQLHEWSNAKKWMSQVGTGKELGQGYWEGVWRKAKENVARSRAEFARREAYNREVDRKRKKIQDDIEQGARRRGDGSIEQIEELLVLFQLILRGKEANVMREGMLGGGSEGPVGIGYDRERTAKENVEETGRLMGEIEKHINSPRSLADLLGVNEKIDV